MTAQFDVVVAGSGPAGLALATACAQQRLRTALVAPSYDMSWPNTYGVWTDELDNLGLVGTSAHTWPVTVVTTEDRTFRLARSYTLLDNDAVRAELRQRFAAADGIEVTGTVARTDGRHTRLADGSSMTSGVVVDATGHKPALLDRVPAPVAFQSAFGVEATCSAPPGEPGAMTLMDVRSSPLGDVSEPTFLYAMDLGGGRWFVEETSLARAAPMPMPELERRLRRRMRAMGITLSDETAVERCVFPMGTPVPHPQPVLAYGAAASMVHPATGYQVGTALSRAPEIARTLADALAPGARATAAEAGWETLWGTDRRRQRALHDLGLACLLRFDPREFERFFAAFFTLPEGRWRAYLSGADDVREVRRAMLAVFARVGRLRLRLVSTALGAGRTRALTGTALRRP